MSDVGERTAVHEGRIAFQRLHQVGHQRIAQQHGHRTIGLEVTGIDRLLLAGTGHDDVTQTTREVFEVGGQAEDRHDFRGDDDVEAVFARIAVARAAQ